ADCRRCLRCRDAAAGTGLAPCRRAPAGPHPPLRRQSGSSPRPTGRPGRIRALSRPLATGVGVCAILLWSSLALLTTGARSVPPLLLTGITFGVAFLIALGLWTARGQNPLQRMRVRPQAWLVGVGGLFGYHFLYF